MVDLLTEQLNEKLINENESIQHTREHKKQKSYADKNATKTPVSSSTTTQKATKFQENISTKKQHRKGASR